MLELDTVSCVNILLRSLPEADLLAMAQHLERVDYARGDVLIPANSPIDHIVFPESGIFSIVLMSSEQRKIEIGIFGRDGMSDGSVLSGIDSVPHQTFIQAAGTGLRISARDLIAVAEVRPNVRMMVSKWLHVLGLQTSQTVLANNSHNVEERLARWLLMCQDRIGGNELDLTHEFLGTILGVRRSTVTLSIHLLEGSGLIRATRGRIAIVDREALIGISDGAYGTCEAEYERIIGPFRDVH